MILDTPNFTLLPFEQTDWESIAGWFYDKEYAGFFRHQPHVLKVADFQNYPALTKSSVLMVRVKGSNQIVGMVQLIPDGKTNRAFYLGLIVDKKFQGKRLPLEILLRVFDYCFNRMGFRKAIIEILESNESLKKTLIESKFLFEGKFLGDCFQNGQYVNELRYCMFDTYFNKNHKQLVDSWG